MNYPDFTTEELSKEQWIVCPNNANYAISNIGRVKRITPQRNTYVGKILEISYVRGYACVNLYIHGQRKLMKIHRLVAAAFLPKPLPYQDQINHIDHNRTNNKVENLEWCSLQENMAWLKKHNRHTHGEHHAKAKLTEKEALYIRHSTEKPGILSKKLSISVETIRCIRKGLTWKHLV